MQNKKLLYWVSYDVYIPEMCNKRLISVVILQILDFPLAELVWDVCHRIVDQRVIVACAILNHLSI